MAHNVERNKEKQGPNKEEWRTFPTHRTHYVIELQGQISLRCADDGLDRPTLSIPASLVYSACNVVHRNGHDRRAAKRQQWHQLQFNNAEHPLALQLGGSDPRALATCAKKAAELGYNEINLNVGCPSSRVQQGTFGACLMKQPALVADCVTAMYEACQIPVTVKCRLGVDEVDTDDALHDFVDQVAHAAVAYLSPRP